MLLCLEGLLPRLHMLLLLRQLRKLLLGVPKKPTSLWKRHEADFKFKAEQPLDVPEKNRYVVSPLKVHLSSTS
jgi:hypothetical protein